jgi:hypothetical protein
MIHLHYPQSRVRSCPAPRLFGGAARNASAEEERNEDTCQTAAAAGTQLWARPINRAPSLHRLVPLEGRGQLGQVEMQPEPQSRWGLTEVVTLEGDSAGVAPEQLERFIASFPISKARTS